jgi:hypothetical protein
MNNVNMYTKKSKQIIKNRQVNNYDDIYPLCKIMLLKFMIVYKE